MWQLEGWRLAFVASVMVAGAVLLGYADWRRLLHAALDDRYGQWARFYVQVGRLPILRKRLIYNFRYSLAFFFCYGLHDLLRWIILLGFDLFVLLALLSPFWRYVFFEDWNPVLAVGVALAGVSLYLGLKLRWGLELCRVHSWSAGTGRCERCGEFLVRSEEQTKRQKAGRAAEVQKRGWWRRFWERRLEKVARQLEAELATAIAKPGMEESPRPAG
ncbi:MAG: hypothetical protein HY236_16240 [Acidobacteria bacterium]|nr:hypothetical protein [Acidobacteriota bacterium]